MRIQPDKPALVWRVTCNDTCKDEEQTTRMPAEMKERLLATLAERLHGELTMSFNVICRVNIHC